MREIAADSNLFVHRLRRCPSRPRFGIAEAQTVVHVVANSLHTRIAAGDRSESTPGKIGEKIGFAVSAVTQIGQRIQWQVLYRDQLSIGIAIVKRTGVYNDSVQLQAQNAGAPVNRLNLLPSSSSHV